MDAQSELIQKLVSFLLMRRYDPGERVPSERELAARFNVGRGNIREAPFSQIWAEASDERLAILRDRAPALPDRCKACRFLAVCNGNLRTRAEAATGDWLGQDPSCYLSPEETLPL